MADRRKKLSELTKYETGNNSLSGNDYFLVVDSTATSNATKTATLDTLRESLLLGSGPYADDAAANTAGIQIGELYYTASGDVKVRLA